MEKCVQKVNEPSKSYTCDDCAKSFERDSGHCGDDAILCGPCAERNIRESALAAGIPASVIEGKTKLSDHFSKDYIDHMRGVK
jgi:hypothetical protein